jgi:macrodomain Ter protein organizer (MatP/YcbG family)
LARFQALAAASVKVTVFLDIAPCSLVEVGRRLRDAHCLRHRVDRMRQYSSLKRRVYFNETSRRYISESCDLKCEVWSLTLKECAEVNVETQEKGSKTKMKTFENEEIYNFVPFIPNIIMAMN